MGLGEQSAFVADGPAHFPSALLRRIAMPALTLAGAAQVLVLLYMLRFWGGWLPLTLSTLGGMLILALLPAAAPLPYWARLTREARSDGGLATAAAEQLRPLAPLVGSMLVLCYWWGRCSLAALGLIAAVGSLASLLPLSDLPSNLPLAGVFLLSVCGATPRILRQTLTVLCLLVSSAAIAWLVVRGIGLPEVFATLHAGAPEGDIFTLAGTLCAGLFLVGPSLCSHEALLCLPSGAARRQGAGLPLAIATLLGTVAMTLLAMRLDRMSAPAGAGADALAGLHGLDLWAPNLLIACAGTLCLLLSQTAARRALNGVWRSYQVSDRGPQQDLMVGLATSLTIFVFFVLRESSWLFAGAGLAYFAALAGAAAVLLLPKRPVDTQQDAAATSAAAIAVESTAKHALIAAAALPPSMNPCWQTRLALAAATFWLMTAVLGLQAWGVQAVLIGLVMVYSGGLLHLGVRIVKLRRSGDRTRASIHAKLLAGMLLILALNGLGYMIAHQALVGEDRALAALIGDIFTAVALLTVCVGLVLPAMIVHALTRAAEVAERLAHGAVAELRECIDALGRGELDGRTLSVDLHLLDTPFQDEIGRIASSINRLQGDVQGAAEGLESARESLRRSRADLFRQARHDSLTGLHNRRAFEEELLRVVADRRHQGNGHALLYLDLDQFKIVNDTCGHDAGDELLRQVSLLLAAQMRGNDILARLGGDEFGVILENCGRETAIRIAEAMLSAIRALSFGWQDRVFRIGVSIGVVHFQSSVTTLTEVMSAADKACYYAKEQGRNRLHAYSPDDDELRTRSGEMHWVSRIHEAMADGRLCLYAQEIVDLRPADAQGAYFELLLRMLDRDGELVPPMAFIPAAERFGVMPLIDRWVVRTVLEQLALLQREGRTEGIECLAINLSGASLTDDTFLAFVKEQFLLTKVPHRFIWFEITETSAIANLNKAKRFIAELRALGCRFGLDDFGAGMSSFGYLRQLEVDFLKIDGAFVKDMLEDPIDRAMVESINRIGQLMGLKTIAAFVQDPRAKAMLQRMGVDMVQGNGVAEPVPFLVRGRDALFNAPISSRVG